MYRKDIFQNNFNVHHNHCQHTATYCPYSKHWSEVIKNKNKIKIKKKLSTASKLNSKITSFFQRKFKTWFL
jgi:hypothetical protein